MMRHVQSLFDHDGTCCEQSRTYAVVVLVGLHTRVPTQAINAQLAMHILTKIRCTPTQQIQVVTRKVLLGCCGTKHYLTVVGKTPLIGVLQSGQPLLRCMCLSTHVMQKSVCIQGNSMTPFCADIQMQQRCFSASACRRVSSSALSWSSILFLCCRPEHRNISSLCSVLNC